MTTAVSATSQADLDGLATALAALGAVIAWGSLVLAIVIAVASVSWGFFFRRWALDAARRGATEFLASPEGRDHLRELAGSGVASRVTSETLQAGGAKPQASGRE